MNILTASCLLNWCFRAFTLFFLVAFASLVSAQTNTWDGSGGATWETASSWSLNRVPLATDDVVIPNNITGTITINSAAVCNSFTINSGGTDQNVDITGSNSLTVTGAVVIGVGTGFGDAIILNVNSGTLNCASITTTAAGIGRSSELNATSGTINVSGHITNGDEINFTGAATMNVGGNMTGGAFADGTSTVTFNGTDQTIDSYTFYNLTFTGSGTKNLADGGTVVNNLVFSGTVSGVTGGSMDINGNMTLGSGTSFNAGVFTHTIAGNINNNGATFTNTESTIILDGAGQTIGGSTATNFNELILSGSGTKVFSFSTTIAGPLFVNAGVVANLGSITTHTANRLTLGGTGRAAGTWGSTSSAATNQNNTYFTPGTTGFITTSVAGGTIYYSRQTGNWNTNATWSTVGYGGAAATSFPTGNAVVNIGGGNFTVTVNGTYNCSELNFQQGVNNSPTVTISGTNTLNVSGIIKLTHAQFLAGDQNTLAINAGTLNAGRLAFFTQALSGSPTLTVSTGTIRITGDVTWSGDANATITFTGAGRLELGGDFLNNTELTFTPSTGTVLYNGLAEQKVGGLTYFNLTMNNISGTIPQLTFDANATVTNTLNMTSGVVNLSGNTFTLGTTGAASTLTRTASTTTNWMYSGTFTRFWRSGVAVTSTSGNYYGLFPLGSSSSSSYRPVAIASTASPTSNNSVSVTHTPTNGTTDLIPAYNDGGTSIVRKHDAPFVIATAVTGGTYTLGVTMTNLNPIGSLPDIRLAKSNGATTVTSSGTHAAATGTVDNPTARRTGVSLANLAGDWRITTTNITDTPLPVTWLSFEGEYVENERMVRLDWVTASEKNNSGFFIERSIDGKEFEELGFIQGHGTTSYKHQYSFADLTVETSSYYQLRQVDFDGLFEYSKWVYVSIVDSNDQNVLYVYPNPVQGDFKIGGNQKELYDILVSTISGEIVLQLVGINLNQAEERMNNILATYPKGIFLIRFVNPGITKTISLIKL